MTAVATTTGLPTLRFRLPGHWWSASLPERSAAVASAGRLIRLRVGMQDERSALRARLLRDFTRAIDEVIGGGGQQLLLAVQIIDGIPLPITIAVYLPDVSLTPAIGTSPERVLRILEQGLTALDADGSDQADEAQGRDLGEFTTVTAARGPALRFERVRHLEVGTRSDPGSADVLIVDYWLAVPSTKRVVLVNLSTTFAALRDPMVMFFDALLRAAYWEPAESGGAGDSSQ